ncbi:MAG: hypothetical protein R3F17_05470 [Planctomycetota bacterium]
MLKDCEFTQGAWVESVHAWLDIEDCMFDNTELVVHRGLALRIS